MNQGFGGRNLALLIACPPGSVVPLLVGTALKQAEQEHQTGLRTPQWVALKVNKDVPAVWLRQLLQTKSPLGRVILGLGETKRHTVLFKCLPLQSGLLLEAPDAFTPNTCDNAIGRRVHFRKLSKR